MSRLGSIAALTASLLVVGCGPASPTRPITPVDTLAPIAEEAELAEGDVVHAVGRGIYIVNIPGEGLIALWEKDPFKGCRVADAGEPGQRREGLPINHEETRFVDPCHGSEYTLDGTYLSGPSPLSMYRLPIEVRDGQVYFQSLNPIEVPRPEPQE